MESMCFLRCVFLFFLFPLLCSCEKETLDTVVEDSEKYRLGNWQLSKVELKNNPFYYGDKIFFVNEQVGYATEFERIFKSTDSGKTWVELDSITNFLASDIHFIDENNGFISGAFVTGSYPTFGNHGGILLKTNDGGENWSYILYPEHNGNIEYYERIYFFDKFNGLIVIMEDINLPKGYLAKTNNGGETWESLDVKINSHWKDFYVSNDIIYIISETNQIHKSSDQGTTWNSMISPFDGIQTIFFHDDKNGYVANGTQMAKTIDGGINWNLISLTFSNIETINFINKNEGIVIDFIGEENDAFDNRGNIMYQTQDGGVNWEASEFIDGYNFHQPTYLNPRTGYSLFWYEFYKIERIN